MFKAPVVFVVGAGASCEANLPDGGKLKEIIANKLDITHELSGRQISGDTRIATAIHTKYGSVFNSVVDQARRVRDALPLAISIDNLVDGHRENAEIEFCGKVGIAAAILEAEGNSLLKFDSRKKMGDQLRQLDKSWYTALSQLLTQGVSKQAVADIFKNVAFVSFNYDRCIEYFLLHALRTYYDLPEVEAAAIVNEVPIIHPYGTIGRLPWQPGDEAAVDFGADSADLVAVSGRLRTFTEQAHDKLALEKLRNYIWSARTLLFLGFAFHDQNMTLLRSNKDKSPPKNVLATTYGMSTSDSQIVRGQIAGLANGTVYSTAEGVKCGELFRNNWRSLSSF